MPEPKKRCGICRRSLYMASVEDGNICSDCLLVFPLDCVPANTTGQTVDIALWGAKRAWMFALEGQPDDVLVAPARPGDPGPSGFSRRRRRR